MHRTAFRSLAVSAAAALALTTAAAAPAQAQAPAPTQGTVSPSSLEHLQHNAASLSLAPLAVPFLVFSAVFCDNEKGHCM